MSVDDAAAVTGSLDTAGGADAAGGAMGNVSGHSLLSVEGSQSAVGPMRVEPARLQELRAECQAELGAAKFAEAYGFMKMRADGYAEAAAADEEDAGTDGRREQGELEALLGPEKSHCARLLQMLVLLEAVHHDEEEEEQW